MALEQRIRIPAYAMVSCLGAGRAAHREALWEGRTGLAEHEIPEMPFQCPVGAVAGVEKIALPDALRPFDNRANRLALAAMRSDGFEERVAAARARWGRDRCGIVVGTSTSGVERLEHVYRDRAEDAPVAPDFSIRHHSSHNAVAEFLAAYLDLGGPCFTVSTACSSSAKALIDAVQCVALGVCDAVAAVGVDSLCLTSLNGFESLQLVSRTPCQPCDKSRSGLTISEAGAALLVERDAEGGARLSGFGESSDGAHMSTPPKDGAGAAQAMRAALARAGLRPEAIDYVNMHGTGTPLNDAAECAAIRDVFGKATPAASIKGAVGHSLGAAGALEIAICLMALEESYAPGTIGLEERDPACDCAILERTREAPLSHVLSNAFGFGGNNCAVILSK